jgi:hypothetical protein
MEEKRQHKYIGLERTENLHPCQKINTSGSMNADKLSVTIIHESECMCA